MKTKGSSPCSENPTLSYPNPIHILISHFFTLHFNIILISVYRWVLFWHSGWYSVSICHRPHGHTTFCHPILLDFIVLTFRLKWKIPWRLLSMEMYRIFEGLIINLYNTASPTVVIRLKSHGDKTELVWAFISRQMFLSETSIKPVLLFRYSISCQINWLYNMVYPINPIFYSFCTGHSNKVFLNA